MLERRVLGCCQAQALVHQGLGLHQGWALVRRGWVLRLVLVRLVLEPREWVQRQVWALVARVLGVIVMVPKAQALARTEAAQPTVVAYANQGCVG